MGTVCGHWLSLVRACYSGYWGGTESSAGQWKVTLDNITHVRQLPLHLPSAAHPAPPVVSAPRTSRRQRPQHLPLSAPSASPVVSASRTSRRQRPQHIPHLGDIKLSVKSYTSPHRQCGGLVFQRSRNLIPLTTLLICSTSLNVQVTLRVHCSIKGAG